MNDQAIILVTKRVTAKDIPMIAKYNPFIISKEPITDRDVIRAFNKEGMLRGISGVDNIKDLNVTIGAETVRIKETVPINNIISVLSGERGYTAIPNEEEVVVDEPDVPIANEQVPVDSLLDKIAFLENAIKDLADELRKSPRQIIMKEDVGSTRECNPKVMGDIEVGWLSNVGG